MKMTSTATRQHAAEVLERMQPDSKLAKTLREQDKAVHEESVNTPPATWEFA